MTPPAPLNALEMQTTKLKETLRKTIHFTIILVPMLAEWNVFATGVLLCLGILFYAINETARIVGVDYGILSRITEAASRPTEEGFVWGPVTLGFGGLVALLYYPHPATTLAVYALALGDGVASLVGRLCGGKRIPGLGKKTFVGSFACFAAVFIGTASLLGSFKLALLAAGLTTAIELVPFKDLDNFLIPSAIGFVFYLIL